MEIASSSKAWYQKYWKTHLTISYWSKWSQSPLSFKGRRNRLHPLDVGPERSITAIIENTIYYMW